MAKEKNATRESDSFASCFSLGIYKRSQGRIARQVTFAALAIGVLSGGLAVERVTDDGDGDLMRYRRCRWRGCCSVACGWRFGW